MAASTVPPLLTEPTRSRTIYAIHDAAGDDLDALRDLVDDLLAGEHNRDLAIADARDHLVRVRQYVDALEALGPPDREALFAAY